MDSVRAAIANLAVSGIKVSPYCLDLMYKIQNKEITYLQALEMLHKRHTNKQETGENHED